jgi:hypothetical protein
MMTNIAAGSKKGLSNSIKVGILDSRLKSMLRMMTVLHTYMARDTKIKIGASGASDKIFLSKLLDARVASTGTHGNLQVIRNSWLGDLLGLWCNCLSGAVDNASVLHETLDHPMIITIAKSSGINARLAEVKITIIAGAAMVMLLGNLGTAFVAEDSENANSWRSAVTSTLTIIGELSKLCEPLVTGSSTASDRNLGARAVIHSGNLFVCVE